MQICTVDDDAEGGAANCKLQQVTDAAKQRIKAQVALLTPKDGTNFEVRATSTRLLAGILMTYCTAILSK